MAQDNRSVDQQYDDELKKQQGSLKAAADSNNKMYDGIRASGDEAYEVMKRDAMINKALSDLAGGPARSSTTLRQRGDSLLRNELGATERQHRRYDKEVDAALANLSSQQAADEISTNGDEHSAPQRQGAGAGAV